MHRLSGFVPGARVLRTMAEAEGQPIDDHPVWYVAGTLGDVSAGGTSLGLVVVFCLL